MTPDIVQAQYEQLESVARSFGKQAEAQAALQKTLRARVAALRGGAWQGAGADAFYAEMDGQVFPATQRLIAALNEAQKVTRQIRALIAAAEQDAAHPFKQRDPAASETRQDERDSRRIDERIALDDRWGRPSGGDRGGTHLDYDWAGGTILERYLTGGGDLIVDNDPRWTEYMRQNTILTDDLRDRALQDAQTMFRDGATQRSLSEQYAMTIENGEGIVGYQYLHGTNADVGGFQRQGAATMTPDGAGGYTVTMNMRYTWNDVIDPNPQYITDQRKSQFAEIITLGIADPYKLRIGWNETTVVHLNERGEVISISNP